MKIPINLGDYHEPTTAPAAKYSLLIAACEETKTKEKGKPQFRISIGFDGHPEFQNITHFVGIPGEGDEPKVLEFKALLLKRFLAAFSIPFGKDGIDTEQLCMQMVGARAELEVGMDEPAPNGNVYNRLVIPRLREEGQAGVVGGKAKAAPPPKR